MVKEVKFITIKLNVNNKSLCDFFNDYFSLLGSIKDSYIIYALHGNMIYREYNLKNLIDMIKLDFNENIEIFESNVFNDSNDFEKLFKLNAKYNISQYMNVSKLAITMFNKAQKQEIEELKKIITKALIIDSDLMNIAKSMFKNNLNVSKTAKDVYMHRNTVINKLDVIKMRTGLNIQNFEDAFILYSFINF